MDFSRIKTREPAQSKRTRTSHKSYFMREFGHQNRDAPFARACAIKTHMDMSQEPFYARIHKNNAGHQNRDVPFVRACAIEMHMGKSQDKKCRAPKSGRTVCASVRDRNALKGVTRATCARIYMQNAGDQDRDAHGQVTTSHNSHREFKGKMLPPKVAGETLRAVEMHMDMSKAAVYARI